MEQCGIQLKIHLLPQKWQDPVGYINCCVLKTPKHQVLTTFLINTAFQPAILEKEDLSTHYIVSDTFSFNAVHSLLTQTEVKQTFSIYEGTLKSSGYAFVLSMNMGFKQSLYLASKECIV